MEELGELDELLDSCWISLELEIDVANISGEGLGAFEDFLRDGCDNGLVLFFVDFLNFCLKGLDPQEDKPELDEILSFLDDLLINQIAIKIGLESLVPQIILNRFLQEGLCIDFEQGFL